MRSQETALMMRRLLQPLRYAAVCVLMGAALRADTVTGGRITSLNPNYLDGYGAYVPGLFYWNNDSGDGAKANIGWCLIGGGQCGMPQAPGLLPFYSTSFTAPSTFYFTSSGNSATAVLRASVTDQKGVGNAYDLFGYYLTDSTGAPIAGTAQTMFTSNDPAGANYILNIVAGQTYAFFIENIQGPQTPFQTTYWYGMNASFNLASGSMPADPIQHFSVFQQASESNYYIGADDADACLNGFQPGITPCVPANQFDYNDMVVQLQTGTPEPAPVALVGGGYLLLAAFLRRRLSA